jgi:NADH-quinone oxidoreductase subunit I
MLDRFAIDYSLCMYCGICIEVCPFDALHWSPEFEYAELDIREPDPREGPAARLAVDGAAAPCRGPGGGGGQGGHRCAASSPEPPG